MVLNLTNQNFRKEVEESNQPVIIDVYAVWCGPCQHMMPMFEELAKKFGDKYKFAKLNVDEARDIAIQYGISSVPTFLFIKDNQVVAKEVGVMSEDDFVDKFKECFV